MSAINHHHQKIQLSGQSLALHPFGAIFWEEKNTLMIADLHIGKVTHFRKHGAPVPDAAANANLDRLIHLLLDFRPGRVLFLGDLFHSKYNREWEGFEQLLGQFRDTTFELILGNHDILPREVFLRANILVHAEPLLIAPFILSHAPLIEWDSATYNLGGHIHPAARLKGPGKQFLKLPCFYFGERQGILPAFGVFTGYGEIHPKSGDKVFVIAEDRVLPLQ